MALTPRLTTYSLDQVTLALGPIIMDGFQEGEAFTVETVELFAKVVGADGKVARYKKLDYSAAITIKLMQTSATNDQLSVLWNLAKRSKNGADIMPLFIRDNSGRTKFAAAEAWIAEQPKSVAFANDIQGREWVIHCAVLEQNVAGN